MTRDMSLTLLLMVGSIAAAVAAPDLRNRAEAESCAQAGKLARPMWNDQSSAQSPFSLPVMANPVSMPACGMDATAQYRMWHHGSAKLVPGCGPASST